MSEEKKRNVWQAVINAILAILTALCASSCTLIACGRTPFDNLAQ